MSTFLVTLATGQQGRATVAALLKGGTKVHAVVRDPTKPAARELESQGVVLFKGSNDDIHVFRNAAKGCKGIFLNLNSWPDNSNPGRQAADILQACKEAGVEHVVASTAGWVGSKEKWDNPLNRSEWLRGFCKNDALVEDAVRHSGIRYLTILRPFWFHSNYLPPAVQEYYPELVSKGEIFHSFKPGAIFPHINVDDIGRFAAMALFDPATFDGEEIELASQNLTVEDVADAIQKATGKPITVRARTLGETDDTNPIVSWQLWANAVDLTVNPEALEKKYKFRFTTLQEYLVQEKKQLNILA
ncbi:NmrA-like family domain-containing protein 1 [Daldinia childiae]|uniref:NmrA-like family domain-containing protein 1 n=1 Tax=Daldinia childiae TaxID=326645 RepID=UPI0014461B74|nr:NmrA-like family domain-containing protein 1 [Daldinia childiae]KAF3069121.1 NmrA-like family domain-containing protein 1 [Daldinia childiae]